MRRLGWIVAGLVVLAVVEIALLIVVGQAIGAMWTLLLVLASSALGVWLLRREGVRAWRLFADEVRAGRPPGNAATEGLLVLMGGVLLVVPGFLTDLVGAVLLIPPTRRLTRSIVLRRFGARLSPDVANSLFGPRRVRARAGQAQPTDATAASDPIQLRRTEAPLRSGAPYDNAAHSGAPYDGTPIEGEIIDPR
jgi:UPF0716 protein FxsA